MQRTATKMAQLTTTRSATENETMVSILKYHAVICDDFDCCCAFLIGGVWFKLE